MGIHRLVGKISILKLLISSATDEFAHSTLTQYTYLVYKLYNSWNWELNKNRWRGIGKDRFLQVWDKTE